MLVSGLEEIGTNICYYGSVYKPRNLNQNFVIFRTFWLKNAACLTKDGGRRVEGRRLRMDQGDMRLDDE